MKKLLAEGTGTFVMVFTGTGVIVLNSIYGTLGSLGISMAFGLSVTAMILLFGRTSGAMINPAVSFGFWHFGKLSAKNLWLYIIWQCIGALLASLCLFLLFPNTKTLGETQIKEYAVTTIFLLELILSFILMLVILTFSQSKQKTISKLTAYTVGLTVGLEAFFFGKYSGASMNPARSLGPAVFSGNFEHLWLYIVAPITGAILATWCYAYFSPKLN